jgi:hypothetical protein
MCSLLPFLQRAEQHIQRLLTLAPQLQQLHEAVLQQQPGSGTQHRQAGAAASKETWTENIQQQARQASLALQQQVQAALCSSTGSAAAAAPAAAGLRHLQAPKQQRQYMYGGLLALQSAHAPQIMHVYDAVRRGRMHAVYSRTPSGAALVQLLLWAVALLQTTEWRSVERITLIAAVDS